jgi:hypothetical protein
MSATVKDSGMGEHVVLLTDFHDFSTTRYYWRLERLPAENVLAKFKNFAQWKESDHPNVVLAVQAVSESHAGRILHDAGQSFSRLEPLLTSGLLTLYRVEP